MGGKHGREAGVVAARRGLRRATDEMASFSSTSPLRTPGIHPRGGFVAKRGEPKGRMMDASIGCAGTARIAQ